ncbi:MAG: hypothetical protein H6817_09450 [Phycisphaerales bacterium]|nr:hypothetical protein [Phycisphaerales bacterium]
MAQTLQLDKWFRDARSVAAIVPAEGHFGMLRRTLDLPAAFAALARREDGGSVVTPAGGKVAGDGVEELVFVRAAPFEVEFAIAQLPARDKYLCDARVSLMVQVLTDRAELDALCSRVLGSRSVVDIAAIERHLFAHIERAVQASVAACDASSLVAGEHADALAKAISDGLAEPCFSSGMAVASTPVVSITSAAYDRTKQAAQRAARALQEHAAQGELRDALAGAQRERLDHLEGMLARLKKLADDSPAVELPELMRAFEESQRGQLYQALFASRARRRMTQWIVVVAGSELLYFDAENPVDIVRRVTIDTPAGALRSVQRDADSGVLMLGAARGVCLIGPEDNAPTHVLLADGADEVRGGFNSVARRGNDVIGTHSELGIVHWRVDQPSSGKSICPDITAKADAVRCGKFSGNHFWCAVDASILRIPADDLSATPQRFDASRGRTVSALWAGDDRVFVGNADGDVLAIDADAEQDSCAPERLHGGSRRAVESIVRVTAGGIERLFFTDTTLAVFSRVIGDTFTCRYEAGGQTVRRAECAADVVAGTTDARDRILIWRADEPHQPVSVININRLTGRSIQDACLIPVAQLA